MFAGVCALLLTPPVFDSTFYSVPSCIHAYAIHSAVP